ncbi:MAG: hypothetical protein R3F60_34095, partial [bacterium]
MPLIRTHALALALLLPACDDGGGGGGGAGGGGGGADAGASSSLGIALEPVPAEATAGALVELAFTVTTPNGPAAGLRVEPTVEAGGGMAIGADSGPDGRGTIAWTLGVAPVRQRLRLSVGPAADTVTVEAQPPDPAPTSA